MKKTNLLKLLLVSFAWLTSSCAKDSAFCGECPLRGTRIALSMGEMKVVETRSEASKNECWIDDAYLLVFGSDGKYKAGEKVAETAISKNEEQKPTLTTELPIATGDKIVVLCNTGVTAMPAFTVGTSTPADINTAFTSAGWSLSLNQSAADSGKGMPMSGTIDSWVNGTECKMYRSVAKIQLLLDIPTGQDITSSFTVDAVEWGLYNEVQEGNVYSTEYAISTPSAVTFADDPEDALPQRAVGATGATAEQQTRYTPEYPSSTKAKTATVTPASAFHKDRTCLLVHTSAGYYRIDLATGNGNEETKAFLDINRNYHYKVTITKVKSRGYETSAEALANPGSNLEYEIVITGDDENYTVSNGQYALTLDKDVVTVFDDKSDLLKFSLRLNADAPVNLTTAVADIVDETKTKAVAIPDDIYLNGVAAVSNQFDLGAILSAENSYTLTCSGAFRNNQASIAALDGCFLRIHLGNITQYVPINVVDVSFYYGTANSIELQPVAGTYSFDCTPYTTTSTTYAYQNTFDPELVYPRSAKMLWSDVSSDHITDATITRSGDKFTLSYTTTGAAGNAVIGIYDLADPLDKKARLLWSYHIWISDRNKAADQGWKTVDFSNHTISANPTYWMMDRNLGATSTVPPTTSTLANTTSFGLLYQWGRKDPFIGGSNSNGSLRKPLYYPTGESDADHESEREPAESDATTGTINYAIGNPLTFIKVTQNNDWVFNNTYTTDAHKRWGVKTSTYVYPVTERSAKSIYDPCPVGYQVAPQDAYSMFIRASSDYDINTVNGVGGNSTTLNIDTETDMGIGLFIYYDGEKSGSTSFFPNVGAYGYQNGEYVKRAQLYWTNSHLSETNPAYGARLGWGGGYYYSVWFLCRAAGLPLRCVRVE